MRGQIFLHVKVIRAPQKGLLLGFGFLFSKAAVAGFCGENGFCDISGSHKILRVGVAGCVSQV